MQNHSVLPQTVRWLVQSRARVLRIVGAVGLSLVFSTMFFFYHRGSIPQVPAGADAVSAQSGGAVKDFKHPTIGSPTLQNQLADSAKKLDVDEQVPKLLRVTLAIEGNGIEMGYHLGAGRGWSKGERVQPGYISYWTGWTYPELVALGDGDHSIICKLDDLSQEQRHTLRIESVDE